MISHLPTLAAFNEPADLYFVDARESRAQIARLPASWANRPQHRMDMWQAADFHLLRSRESHAHEMHVVTVTLEP